MPSNTPDFTEALSSLVSKEMVAAHGNPDRIGIVIERLAAALGFTIALAAKGNPAGIDEMIEGATGYAHSEAVQRAPFAKMMTNPKLKERENG